ncbi:hypothetical protein [Actinoplanes sp. N902-109]|uniref:hypothetical protein n=1 Tax=Actinoplanes sp. (strain N902-109) TaxID=649831 RepID=UPI0003294567|nr:hypothetical protein [Actinoplanes sp. N902-109]AGL17957.1 hypothetical protein L083_4447 [Actinoplanes sp. N902-109]
MPTLNAQTQYKVKYTDQTLKVRPDCGYGVYVDLDEPRVQVESDVAELNFSNNCTTAGTIHFELSNDVFGSAVDSESVTPIECAEQVRTSPLAQGRDEPVRRGSVYCIMTSRNAAQASGISWKMVILSVTSTSQNDTVTLKVSSWDIPV